jgi:hypothetical protein
LIAFDRNGKGIGAVGRLGQGVGEYLRITDFDVDKDGNIFLLDATGSENRLFKFDSELNYVWTKYIPLEVDCLLCLNNGNFLLGIPSWEERRNVKVAVVNPDLSILETYLKYDEYKDDNFMISFPTFFKSNNSIFYNRSIDNHIYIFDSDGKLQRTVYIDFGSQNVSLPIRKDIERNLDEFKNYTCIQHLGVVTDRYILGTVWEKHDERMFIIDRNSGILYKGEKVQDFERSRLLDFYDNTIVSYIDLQTYEDIDSTDLPKDLKQHVKEDNIVLCLDKLHS